MKQLLSLTKRQLFILQVISELKKATNGEILKRVVERFDASRITLVRDLNELVLQKKLRRLGKGRSIFYELTAPPLLKTFDLETYFQEETDKRHIREDRIDFANKKGFSELFTQQELHSIGMLTKTYQKRLKTYDSALIQKELERITIEFSWRSSHIEGNTYSLLDTERLIKEHREAVGKTHGEALMILNHKTALEYVWRHAKDFSTLSLRKIEEIHDLIVKNLGITRGLRKRPVGIVGTRYKPFDNIFQIREAMENLCRLINKTKHPFEKACVAVAGISYIQPFEDGNKRTSRLLGNAILLTHRYCPLSYRSVDETEYKKAIILFYEQHTFAAFKKIFLEQYEFAVENYFR